MTTLSTMWGKVRTGSTRRFIAVIKVNGSDVPKIHARSDSRTTLETRLRREGFSPVSGPQALFAKHEPGKIIEGVPTPGRLIAAVEIVEA